MNAFADQIKTLRGKMSLEKAARLCEVSVGTYINLEKGSSVRLSTLLKIKSAFKVKDPDWLELLIGWIRIELKGDADKLIIQPKDSAPSALRDSHVNLVTELQKSVANLPAKDQREMLKAISRPAVLKSIGYLNEIYDKGKES